MRTDFVSEWESRPGDAAEQSERLMGEIMGAGREARTHELLPFTGQAAGMISDLQPAAKIVQSMVAEAERVVKFG